MQKKLEAELISLAHSVLQMKNRDDALALKEKALKIYENLAVLTFVDSYIATSPNLKTTKEELLKQFEGKAEALSNKSKELPKAKPEIKSSSESKPVSNENIFEPKFDGVRIDIASLKPNQISIKEEFKDSISADKTSTLFEDDDKLESGKKSLNDKFLKNELQIGLNDRIAFVNHLFNFKQADFNRVLSQLNTFKSEVQAKDFILKKVKPDYNWSGKEEYEERLLSLIERKFL